MIIFYNNEYYNIVALYDDTFCTNVAVLQLCAAESLLSRCSYVKYLKWKCDEQENIYIGVYLELGNS